MDTTEIIHNALEWANKRLELQGEPITENQRNYIVFALRQQFVVGQSEQLVCPECKSTDCKTAIHTDYKECNKCYHYWEAN